MILHTVVPMEEVLKGMDKLSTENLEEVCYHGVSMVVEPVGRGRGRIIRLLSADPARYLDVKLSPGSIIRYE